MYKASTQGWISVLGISDIGGLVWGQSVDAAVYTTTYSGWRLLVSGIDVFTVDLSQSSD
jgi:hypothetical protein